MASQAPPIELGGRERVQVKLGGFGGQGIILAGYILGRAASVHAGRNAVMSQSYGPESRGGACAAEVVITDGEIAYPRIVDPDLVVTMSEEAYRTYARDRSEACLLVVDEDLVTVDEDRERDRPVLRVPATRLAEELGRRMVANIVMLGFVCRTTNVVPEEAMRQAVEASVPRGSEELNVRALEAGFRHAELLLRGSREGDG